MRKLLFFAFLCLLIFSVVDAQQRRRNRNRKKGTNCHLKEIDKCMEKMEAMGKRPQASDIITTDAGIDELCKTVSGSMDCIKGFMKKCGTPIQRELFDFMLEQFVESVNLFCNTGETRKTFLEHSPCINSKVLVTKAYHKNCVNDIFAALDKGQRLFNSTLDDPELFNFEKTSAKGLSDKLLDLSCCSYNRFDKCSNDLIVKECGQGAVDAMNNFAQKTFGGSMNRFCPKSMFNPTKASCTSVLPPTGSDPKIADLNKNPIGKYMLTYMNFLFNFQDAAGAAAAA